MVFAVFSRFHVSLLKGDIDFFWGRETHRGKFCCWKKHRKTEVWHSEPWFICLYLVLGRGSGKGCLVCVFMLYIICTYIYIPNTQDMVYLPTLTPVNYPNVGK